MKKQIFIQAIDVVSIVSTASGYEYKYQSYSEDRETDIKVKWIIEWDYEVEKRIGLKPGPVWIQRPCP